MKNFDYSRPRTIDEAIRLLSELKGRSFILAGGTDMIPLMHVRGLSPQHIVDVKALEELKGITVEDGWLRIGATVTVHQIWSNPYIAGEYPALHEAAASLGSFPVRCQATIGGNVCRASPSGDLLPSLLLYDAEVTLVNSSGRRKADLDEFFLGPGETICHEDEILMEILLPPSGSGAQSTYLKYSPRRAMDLAIAGIGVGIWPNSDGLEDVRIALGAVGPTPFRAREAEGAWKHRGPISWDEVGKIAAGECQPIDDIRGTEMYRRKVVSVFVARILGNLSAKMHNNEIST